MLTPLLPAVYSKSLILDVQDIWDGLFLYWLLQDCQEQEEILELPHDMPSQTKRLQPALQARNRHMVGPGQEEWNHACDLCCWINSLSDGSQST